VLRTCSIAVARAGLRAVVAENGVAGLESFIDLRDEICLVLADIIMPVMSGVEMAVKILELDKDAKIVLMSGYSDSVIEIEGRARYYEDIRDVPYSWTVEQKYASGPTVIHMDLVTAKKRAKQFELGGMASLVTGSKGWIWVSRQGVRTEPESLAQTAIGPNEKHVLFSDDHKQNFLDAIRKKARPISPITAAVHAETMCQQSAIAMQLQRRLRWDPKAERFIDDEQANRLLSRAIRAPWSYTT